MRSLIFFFHLLGWFSLRQLRIYLGRTFAVLLGIALGAAVFTSVRLAVNASLDSFSKSMSLIAGQSDWVVARRGGRISENLIPRLLNHPAVQTASPILTTYVKTGSEPTEVFLLIGFDPILDRPLREWKRQQERTDSTNAWLDLIKEPFSLLVGQSLATRLELETGELLHLKHVQREASFRVLGILAPEGLALVEGGRVALADIATFQEFTGLIGQVDRIDLVLEPSATEAEVDEIRAILPSGHLLEKPSRAGETGSEMIRAYQLNLSVLSFVSLFVGMFLVYSLVSLNAASRRHELAILRSLGASARLIFLLFVSEGAFLGIIGWVTAIPLSAFLLKYLLEAVSRTISTLFVRVQVDRLNLDWWEILLSFGITTIVSLLAASQPAREAMAVPAREALSIHSSRPGQKQVVRRLAFLGMGLIIFAWPLSQLPHISAFPLAGYVATFWLFLGFSMLSPWVLHGVGISLPPLLRKWGGEPAYLGGRYVRDAGMRTAISVGALITAMALFTALIIMVHSFRGTVTLWVNQTISGDLFIRPQTADLNHYKDPIPTEFIERLREFESRVDLVPYYRAHLRYEDIPYQFDAIDMVAFNRYARFLFLRGDEKSVIPRLIEGQGVIVSEVFATRTGLGVGQRYRDWVEGILLDLPILGIFRDYRTQGGVVHYSLKHFQEQSSDEIWSGVRLYFRDRDRDLERAAIELRQEILDCCVHQYGLEITVGGELRRTILRIFDETFAITTVLLLIALLVAALGITTTLTVLVLERRSELNTLVAVGSSFGQIRAMIFWEATLMVIVGEVLGLLCGFLLSYFLIFVINLQSFGWTFLYRVDWIALLGSLPLILTTALLASLPASRLVFRQSPALVLRER